MGGRTVAVGLAAVGAGVAVALLAWVASRSEAPARAARPEQPYLAAAYDRAAAQAHGQRVLVIHAPSGGEARGELFESSRAPEGWRLLPAVPESAADLLPALESLAAAAAADWRTDQRLAPGTVRALGYFDVAIVLVEDGRRAVVPQVDTLDPALALRANVPGLAVRKALPVVHLLAEPELADPAADVLEYARRLRVGDAHVADLQDAGWGGSLRIQAHGDADYLFAWPAGGARVTVDGKPVEATPAALPLIRLRLAKGTHAVSVTYGERGGSAWVAIGAAVLLVASLVILLLAIRPRIEREGA
jgi:hypothetical protein